MKKNRSAKITASVSTLFVLVFLFSVGIAPLHKMNEIKEAVEADSVFIQQYDSLYSIAEIIPLTRKKAYTESLLKLSEKDSIHLIVNLHDSLVGLYINGVQIHKIPIRYFKNDKLLKNLSNHEYLNIFSSPVPIRSQESTIIKEPIVVRHAPKDTLEASLNAYKPDSVIQDPAFLSLQIDHGINLIFEQDQLSERKDKWARWKFRSGIWAGRARQNIIDFFNLKKIGYAPALVLEMPADELRAIYRALPTHAFVVIYYE